MSQSRADRAQVAGMSDVAFHYPQSESELKKHLPKFSVWLIEHGSEIHAPTNPYELARFLTDVGVGVIYRNSGSRISSWQNGADRAFKAFRLGQPWRAIEKVGRLTKKTKRLYASLADRDGAFCIYCGIGLPLDLATIEHIIPVTSGGPDHLSNKALACSPCNIAVGALPAAQKIDFAVTQRGTKVARRGE